MKSRVQWSIYGDSGIVRLGTFHSDDELSEVVEHAERIVRAFLWGERVGRVQVFSARGEVLVDNVYKEVAV